MMKANQLVGLAAMCVAAVCGCVPTVLPKATITSVSRISQTVDGQTAFYPLKAEQQAILRNEFETWKKAGFEGFDSSYVDHVPSVNIVGTLEDGTAYVVDFGEEIVVVNEVDGMGEKSQYVRNVTPADNRFRLFLLACIEDWKGSCE